MPIKLRIIDLESDAFKELNQFKGQLFHDWEAFWNKLNYNDSTLAILENAQTL